MPPSTTPPSRPAGHRARPPVRRSGAERGFALLMVMLLLLILAPFAYEFTTQVNLEALTAVNVTDQLMIEKEIDGQYEIMLAHLTYDLTENEVDTADDAWNDSDLTSRREEETGVALTTNVFDEMAKLNLRMLAEGPPERQVVFKKRLKQLLIEFRRDTDFDLSESEAETWANHITEYIKKGGSRTGIPSPRMADGRSILILEELTFVPKVGEHTFDQILHDMREEDRVAPGLHRFVTLYGAGKLNLNTTDERVLRAYFPVNPELAERLIERRASPPEDDEDLSAGPAETEEGTEVGNPYTDVTQVSQVEGVDPKSLQANEVDPTLDFDTKSNFFSFRIVGETETARRDELFVVERVPGAAEGEPMEGFRLLLRQERVDPLEALEESE